MLNRLDETARGKTTGHDAPRRETTAGAAEQEVCMDVIRVLDLFAIEKRSDTLNGSIPLRAAQGCKPVLEGNAAGFQLRLKRPAVVSKTRRGPALQLTDEAYDEATTGYAEKIARLVERGLVREGGHWHTELSKGFAWAEPGALFLWTGLLVRPAQGTWLLVSGAFNRRCMIGVEEHVIADDAAFVPVILRLDASSLRLKETWLDVELACLLPLRPEAAFNVRPMRERPEVGRSFCDFYDDHYLDAKGEGNYLGRYRKFTARETNEDDAGAQGACELLYAGPDIHEIGRFERFATADGLSDTHPEQDSLQFGVVRNLCDIAGRWDGMAARDLVSEMPEEVERFREEWAALYGAERLSSIDWLCEYAIYNAAPAHGEPYLMVVPWVFAVTPPGWSSVVDGYHTDALEGLRGVISTDTFHGIQHITRFQAPGKFAVGRGERLERILPIPRRLLRATFRTLPFEDDASASASSAETPEGTV